MVADPAARQAIVTTDAGKARLRRAVVAGRVIEDETADIQREICREVRLRRGGRRGHPRRTDTDRLTLVGLQFGHDGEYGMRCFRRVLDYYKGDAAMSYQFMQFCQMCVCACVRCCSPLLSKKMLSPP